MIVPCEVLKLGMDGLYEDKLYQPLIIEDGVEYDIVKTPDIVLEIWWGEDNYIFDEKDYVICSRITGEYTIVAYDKVKYQ